MPLGAVRLGSSRGLRTWALAHLVIHVGNRHWDWEVYGHGMSRI